MSSETQIQFFEAIEKGDAEQVRNLLAKNKELTTMKQKSERYKYENEWEIDAYKFLGAYLGPITGLHLAVLKSQDGIAKDIIESTLSIEDLDLTFGGGNTALHLATFLGQKEVVKMLLERGAGSGIKNAKGFRPIDVLDDQEMRDIYSNSG